MRASAAVALLLVATAAAAQQPAFKSGVELVRIPVNVTQGDKPVEPGVLTAADFKVTEDGAEQSIALFERESLPLSICVVFDVSGSMRGSNADVALTAFRQVLTRLLPEDEVSVIAFAAAPAGGGAPGGVPDGEASNVLERLVGDSGGVAYRMSHGENAASLASAFVDDLRLQYTIGYTPAKALDGKYRRVKVEVKKRGFKIRHRGGYLALASESSPKPQ